MKRFMAWLFVVAVVVFIIDWSYVGLKLALHEYGITVFAYIGPVCWITMIVCLLYRAFNKKCPHCGHLLITTGAYCPHCGKRKNEIQ